MPRRPTEVAIIRLFLECISLSAIAWTAIERLREILGVNAWTAPDDNTPRVIKAHAVLRLPKVGADSCRAKGLGKITSNFNYVYEFVVLFEMARRFGTN